MSGTIFSILVLVLAAFLTKLVWMIVSNLAGLPGVLVAGRSPTRPRWRLHVGTTVAFVGQAYVALAYVAWVTAWTRLSSARPDVWGVVLWPVACFVVTSRMWGDLIAARVEDREREGPLNADGAVQANVQVEALHLTTLAAILGFLVFAFFPRVAAAGWPWVPFVRAAAGI